MTNSPGISSLVDAHESRGGFVGLAGSPYPPIFLHHAARPYDGGDLVPVIATRVDTAPGSTPEIEVGEGSPVSEVEHRSTAIQLPVPKTPRRGSDVGSKAQLTLLVVSCSLTEHRSLVWFHLHKGSFPGEGPANSGSVVLDRSIEVPGPHEEGERVEDLHGSRFRRGAGHEGGLADQ